MTTDPTTEPDAEVERLAERAWQAGSTGVVSYPWASIHTQERWRAGVRSVLADLRERYILVPRDGAEEYEDWGVRSPHAGYIGYAVDKEHAAELVATIRPGWTVVHRTDVRGTWQVAQ